MRPGLGLVWVGVLLLALDLPGRCQCEFIRRRLLLEGTQSADEQPANSSAPGWLDRVTAYVSAGVPAQPGQFPWMVALYHNNSDPNTQYRHYCGGALVSRWVIMTAAHCTHDAFGNDRYPFYVRIGLTDVLNGSAVQRKVTRIYRHPGYDFKNDARNYAYDIALLQLDRRVKSLPFAKLALPDDAPLRLEQPLSVMGFGGTPTEYLSRYLLYATVRYVLPQDCRAYYAPFAIFPGNTSICAGSLSTADACGGDSGSPLVTQGREPVQVGIVSFGPTNCGGVAHIAGYSNVAMLQPWVASMLPKLAQDAKGDGEDSVSGGEGTDGGSRNGSSVTSEVGGAGAVPPASPPYARPALPAVAPPVQRPGPDTTSD